MLSGNRSRNNFATDIWAPLTSLSTSLKGMSRKQHFSTSTYGRDLRRTRSTACGVEYSGLGPYRRRALILPLSRACRPATPASSMLWRDPQLLASVHFSHGGPALANDAVQLLERRRMWPLGAASGTTSILAPWRPVVQFPRYTATSSQISFARPRRRRITLRFQLQSGHSQHVSFLSAERRSGAGLAGVAGGAGSGAFAAFRRRRA